ncbi:lycopene cyclase family protein [Rhodohalobacter sp.]|uniref:lycopene cyclase family protein n=1 Tax=Rhodohalobacter sp. TaxID=1974210 RepID=UPI003564BA99
MRSIDKNDHIYDYIIAGAGASGLSLLWNMLQSDKLRSKSILLVDLNFTPVNDKTWCFWDNSNIPFEELIYHTWSNLEVSALSNSMNEDLSRYKYYCIRSVDYSEKILSLAEKSGNVTLMESKIYDFKTDENLGVIATDYGNFKAKHIFQSALKPPGLQKEKLDISLKQHFLGWEIETRKNLFDPDKAIFMDFDISQSNGLSFFYSLPFSKTKALIEYTIFSSDVLTDEQYEFELIKYLKTKFNLESNDYSIIRREKGVIPMEDRRYPFMYCNYVYNMGTAGGLTKPTTGYTFTRIQKHSREIVNALEKETAIPKQRASTYRFRIYDIMLLSILDQQDDISVQIFHDLFKHNSFDRILQFLEEGTHLGQELKIFSTLPYTPFFKSIWKMKHRIFTGA